MTCTTVLIYALWFSTIWTSFANRVNDNALWCSESIYHMKGTCTITGYQISEPTEFVLNKTVMYNKSAIAHLRFINSVLLYTPDDIFLELEYVKSLDLSGCQVAAISNSTFAFGYNLQLLNLSRNLITNIPYYAFKEADNLVHIDLSHNHIRTIDAKAFKNYRKLVRIDLSHNDINIVSSNIFPPILSHLNLDFNRIAEFSVSDLTKIDHLSLNNNELVSLQLNAQTNLLSADNNYLRSDNLIVNNSNVNSLSLKNNSIIRLDGLEALSNLTYLDVSHNPINYSCTDCRGFANLRTFILKSTNLTERNFGRFPELFELETLDVSSNNLSYIDFNQISRLENLQFLNLRDNRLSKLTFNEFDYLFPRLNSIDISENNWMCSDLMAVLSKFKQLEINHEMVYASSNSLGTNIRGIRCSTSTISNIEIKRDSDLQIDGTSELVKILNQLQNDNEMLKMNLNEIYKRLDDNAESVQPNLVDHQISSDMKAMMDQIIEEMRIEIMSAIDSADDEIESNQIKELAAIVIKIDSSFEKLYDIKIYVMVAVLLLANLFIIYVTVIVYRRCRGSNKELYNNYDFPTIHCQKKTEGVQV